MINVRYMARKPRGKSDSMAFIAMGDQFIALQNSRSQPADDGRHFATSTIRSPLARYSRQLVLGRLMGHSLIFETLGATE
jgi:hypothetical protein